jgi:hypothetical protein
MKSGFRIPKPAAPGRTHLLAAAVLWSLSGLGLFLTGTAWMAGSRVRSWPLFALAAVAVGALKARLALRGAALRIAARIEARGDGKCLGGFLSWRSWLIVFSMMALGRLLRMSPLAVHLRGAVYAAIGTALLFASGAFWSRWSSTRQVG